MKDMNEANRVFAQGAESVFYGDGRCWMKDEPRGFTPHEFEYMRSIREYDGAYMFAIDLDSEIGMNDKLLGAAKDFYDYFGRSGILKASGVKGMHIIPYRLTFSHKYSDDARLKILENIAYTAYIECNIHKKYGLPFLKRSKNTDPALIRDGYVDTTMFTKSRKIRGFCRRFNKRGKIMAWSVPVEFDDTMDDMLKKVRLAIKPEWDKTIPRVQFHPRMIRHEVKVEKRGRYEGFTKRELGLNKSDTLDVIMEKLMESMTPSIREVWQSDDPGHQDKFGLVCWLNFTLLTDVPDDAKRVAIITELIAQFMPMSSYRDSHRFSYDVTRYQVDSIIYGEYDCPKWVWE